MSARKAVIAGTLAAALLGIGAEQAAASYTGRVQDDTLTLSGNSASDKLIVRIGTTTNELVADVGDDGTADLSFDRTQFTNIVVNAGGGDDSVVLSAPPVCSATSRSRSTAAAALTR